MNVKLGICSVVHMKSVLILSVYTFVRSIFNSQIGLPICYEIPIEHSGDIKEWFIIAYPRAFVKQVNYSYRRLNCRIMTEVNFNLKERRFFCDNCLSIFSHLPNYQVVLLALHSVESKVD